MGKRQRLETENQEVLSTYRNSGSPEYLRIGREKKRQGFETETHEVLRTYSKGGKGDGITETRTKS